ncbi:MAG: hypothetical protein P8O05_12005, partial [Flavobacteriales bacterium]|nr:hypothetical protein [Flavobacteriales bacterium]
APVLKTGVPQGTGGSNPSLSAKSPERPSGLFFMPIFQVLQRFYRIISNTPFGGKYPALKT